MKLTVLGCNGPYPAPDGACSGYLLQEGDTRVLLDCGAGVLAQLEKHMPPQDLTAIVLSHLHYDHMSDMLPLIYRCPGLPVYLPGAPAAVRALLENAFELHDIAQGGQIGCLRMMACPGRHPVPAYAARFENGDGRALVYTGDTNTCPEMADFAKDCDLLLADGCFVMKNIFFNKAPLHDGALIIRDNRFYSAGCLLPLTQNENIIKDLGTRHRAAIGMSENSDAVVVVVSEETGVVSIAVEGKLIRNLNDKSLKTQLLTLLIGEDERNQKDKAKKHKGVFSKNKSDKTEVNGSDER